MHQSIKLHMPWCNTILSNRMHGNYLCLKSFQQWSSGFPHFLLDNKLFSCKILHFLQLLMPYYFAIAASSTDTSLLTDSHA